MPHVDHTHTVSILRRIHLHQSTIHTDCYSDTHASRLNTATRPRPRQHPDTLSESLLVITRAREQRARLQTPSARAPVVYRARFAEPVPARFCALATAGSALARQAPSSSHPIASSARPSDPRVSRRGGHPANHHLHTAATYLSASRRPGAGCFDSSPAGGPKPCLFLNPPGGPEAQGCRVA